MEKNFKVKSLAKAVTVLEAFTNSQPELGITDISQMLHLQKSTVHNIVSTYESLGYLVQNKETGKYYLGVKLLRFSYIINSHMGFHKFFLPYMKEISGKLNEIVFLGIPYDGEVLYMEAQIPDGAMVSRNILGEHAPMYCTGLGKAMLAFLPENERQLYMPKRFAKFTENTILSEKELLIDLQKTRERGYSIDNMEHEYGVKCFAVPIFGNDGRVIAAISVSGPSLRFDDGTVQKNAGILEQILKPIQYTL